MRFNPLMNNVPHQSSSIDWFLHDGNIGRSWVETNTALQRH